MEGEVIDTKSIGAFPDPILEARAKQDQSIIYNSVAGSQRSPCHCFDMSTSPLLHLYSIMSLQYTIVRWPGF